MFREHKSARFAVGGLKVAIPRPLAIPPVFRMLRLLGVGKRCRYTSVCCASCGVRDPECIKGGSAFIPILNPAETDGDAVFGMRHYPALRKKSFTTRILSYRSKHTLNACVNDVQAEITLETRTNHDV
ncbi:hypothetical protein Fuma_03237 [Fuerstiella marisgermanici]|uniref:Uncharacterized protein n=1 Tax=Fuerstiella marisgermanici TaxID=1891926 RepID=A0A1P8WHT4_9PLAN|nr:hypothetical protein Fuma_03237 [Fuerstiella marisgermanici]